MANTLTNLIPLAYEALDVVSRELVGYIPSVSLDASAEMIAKGQTLYSPVAPANTQGDITPAMTVTAASDQTIGTTNLTISNYKSAGFNWTAEEEFAINQGVGIQNIMRDQLAQCMRVHTNAIELSLAQLAQLNASRATGTSGVTPFATNLSNTANVRKILDDNGAPGGQIAGNRSLVMNTTCGAAVRTLTQLTKANEAADSTLLRRGTLLDIHGFSLRESAQVVTTTAGTGTNYVTNHATYPVGTTSIACDVGSGTILAGDVVTIGNFKYVVATTLSANVFVIAAPGLQEAVADDTAITVNAAYAANTAFSRNALVLATRLPKWIPTALCSDRQIITDPVSGISFELTMWPGQRMIKYEVSIAYGSFCPKPEHIATLLG